MSRILLILALCVITVYSQTADPNCGFFTSHPQSQQAALGDVVEFSCELNEALFAFPRIFRHYMPSGATYDISFSNLVEAEGRGYSIPINETTGFRIPSVLRLGEVRPDQAGTYACFVNKQGCSSIFSGNATLTIIGEPRINVPDSTILEVDTTQDLVFRLIITGTEPDVDVYRIEDSGMTLIQPETHSRIDYSFEMGQLVLTISGLRRSDAGMYFIEAVNNYGKDNITIEVAPQGPDPPIVSLQPVAVLNYGSSISIQCSLENPADADSDSLMFMWMDNRNRVISAGVDNNGQTSTLTLTSLTPEMTGAYDCIAQNDRGFDDETVMVFGPPPTLSEAPRISGVGRQRTVSWSRPATANALEPITSYEVIIRMDNVLIETADGTPRIVSVQQNQTEFEYQVPPVLEAGDYTVTITPISAVDGGEPVRGEESAAAEFPIAMEEFPLVAVVVGVVASVAVLVAFGAAICAFLLCFYYPHRRQLRSQEQSWSGEDLKDGAVPNKYTSMTLRPSSELPASPGMNSPSSSSFLLDIDPKWEFPRENIKLSDTLCTGQFTKLYKGIATGIKDNAVDVAVKAVRDDATEDDVKALMAEMELLSSIGTHENLLSMIRVCTVGKPMYMVMEYMCHGDLLGFLRASRGHYGRYTVSPGAGYQPPAINLYPRDLLNIGAKIASGMTYLADRKLVHRSLCAKNVLVGSNMSIKICNVGSFDMVVEGEYIMKWMAPETLFDQTATTYSDVWSFGVTLWELVTVGGNPYGDTPAEQLYSQLMSGMRMTCPEHCSPEIHDLMLECWMRNPMDRPHFSEIYDKLDDLAMSKMNLLDFQAYDVHAYSKFEEPAPLLTVL